MSLVGHIVHAGLVSEARVEFNERDSIECILLLCLADGEQLVNYLVSLLAVSVSEDKLKLCEFLYIDCGAHSVSYECAKSCDPLCVLSLPFGNRRQNSLENFGGLCVIFLGDAVVLYLLIELDLFLLALE